MNGFDFFDAVPDSDFVFGMISSVLGTADSGASFAIGTWTACGTEIET